MSFSDTLDLQEQIARIGRELAATAQMTADETRKRQEIRFAPWQLFTAGALSMAALIGAGVTLSIFLLKLWHGAPL